MSKYCSECGTEVPGGSKFCPNCGFASGTSGGAGNQPASVPIMGGKTKGLTSVMKSIGVVLVILLIIGLLLGTVDEDYSSTPAPSDGELESWYIEEPELRYVEERGSELRHMEESEGSISITSTPSGASVYLDGTHRGTTPISLDNVVSGPHTIELAKSGYESKTLAVSLSAGGAENIWESLEPLTGSISISSNPSGANIYLDEASNGVTPKTISDVQTGSHTIRLEKSGYESVTITASVHTGETATVYETLTSKIGSISMSSTPSGANIYLDGIYKGTTPTTISGVLPGSHAIRLEKNDYEDYLLESVFVTAGVTTPRTANLILKPVLVPCDVTVLGRNSRTPPPVRHHITHHL